MEDRDCGSKPASAKKKKKKSLQDPVSKNKPGVRVHDCNLIYLGDGRMSIMDQGWS
jgi:hypothetical protein